MILAHNFREGQSLFSEAVAQEHPVRTLVFIQEGIWLAYNTFLIRMLVTGIYSVCENSLSMKLYPYKMCTSVHILVYIF